MYQDRFAAVAPTPTPTPVAGLKDLPELQSISVNLVTFEQGIGILLLGVVIALIGLMLLTSFGNDHRHVLIRAAALSLIVGFMLVIYADKLSSIIQLLFRH